jgi:hypothetical protein
MNRAVPQWHCTIMLGAYARWFVRSRRSARAQPSSSRQRRRKQHTPYPLSAEAQVLLAELLGMRTNPAQSSVLNLKERAANSGDYARISGMGRQRQNEASAGKAGRGPADSSLGNKHRSNNHKGENMTEWGKREPYRKVGAFYIACIIAKSLVELR